MAVSSKLKRKLEKRKEQLSKKGGGKFQFFLIKEGSMRVRLLPVEEEKEFAIEATYFWISKEQGAIVSPATFGEPCPMMEAYQKLKNSKDDDDRAMAEKIKPKKRYFAMCIKFQDEKGKKVDTESGPKLVILTGGLYQSLIDLYLDDEYGDFTDPRNGYDVLFKRVGTGQYDTEYSVIPRKSTPLPQGYRKEQYDPETELRKIIPSFEDIQDLVKQVVGISSSSGLKKKKKLLKKKIKNRH